MIRTSNHAAEQTFPFSALVGQDLMKRALLLNVVDPTLGGVLIKGERGTAKSTGVRALADLLPLIRVVENCPFRCDPDAPDDWCPSCRRRAASGGPLPVVERKVPLVNLPIGTTEDRLLGTIDIEKALKTGTKAFEPGLLAEAHRGILYVDEVNLLNDQIVDLFLDAAASGRNVVEREGISFSHASRFVLVGTMNPEEGDLRPQLLDRFGLSVTIQGIESVEERVEIVKRRLEFEADPEGFRARWAEADRELARRIASARSRLHSTAFTEELLQRASRIAVAMGTDGHRADIAMMKAARANAALEGRDAVTADDLHLAARLVLAHRVKKTPLEKAELDEGKLKELLQAETSAAAGEAREWVPVHQNAPKHSSKVRTYKAPTECATHLCPTARSLVVTVPWHRILPGTHPGRRFLLPLARKSGTIHGSRHPRPQDDLSDLSLMATLRAAAPCQPHRRNGGPHERPILLPHDLRLRKRSRKTGLSLVMVVDSSASMRTNDRMAVTKGVIDALLQDLYLRRDKLGIVAFRHTGAQVLLPLTHNIRDAAAAVDALPVGGRTPLASGLDLGLRLLRQEMRKNPETVPVLLLFSDGRPNVSCFGADPVDETFHYAREVRRHGIQALFVDTEMDPMAMGCSYEIARRMGAVYLPVDRLLNGR
ncbi:protoporphyrin IX magnesium-chelatase [Desulfacinum hydrothermale DSM 13146]|uniref:Mg-protoporphyrin IX chelatase n=1 Tax=Desulfacinum hydrothermale DSM 13146 TaxID=1121390 RepID=A0A1W1X0M7_9BACT|nr:VWA domain-containing protein [Desulfacinum hydrothermale]SMC17464.1 protoporphyrin IX magnesium-chelatase [Desulfacinum hydrothermale DSM 13146]